MKRKEDPEAPVAPTYDDPLFEAAKKAEVPEGGRVMEDETALATVVDDAPHTPLTPPEDDEDDGPASLLDKKSTDCLISVTVKARRALADFLATEEGYYLTQRDRAAITAADSTLLRVLRQAREDFSLL